jgi:hypothetical protein
MLFKVEWDEITEYGELKRYVDEAVTTDFKILSRHSSKMRPKKAHTSVNTVSRYYHLKVRARNFKKVSHFNIEGTQSMPHPVSFKKHKHYHFCSEWTWVGLTTTQSVIKSWKLKKKSRMLLTYCDRKWIIDTFSIEFYLKNDRIIPK